MALDTLALDPETWDLDVDAYGNWETFGDATGSGNDANGPAMRMAQDVATQCLSWLGEVYYDATQGILYPQLLGGAPNLALVNATFSQQALTVPLVVQAFANFTFTAGKARALTGTLLTTDVNGNVATVQL
jgi:hypothetical protein